MFITKLLLYISYSGDNAKAILKYKLVERITGSNTTENYTITDAIKLNLSCIKGITYNNWCYIVIIVSIIVASYIYLVHGINKYNTSLIVLLIGLIPLITLVKNEIIQKKVKVNKGGKVKT